MTHQEVHSKRIKRTSIKKADTYRKRAAFFQQRNFALLKDLHGEQKAKKKSQQNEDLLNKHASVLAIELKQANEYVEWLNGLWLVRQILKIKKYQKQ